MSTNIYPSTIVVTGDSSLETVTYENHPGKEVSDFLAGPDRVRINPAIAYLSSLQAKTSQSTMGYVLNKTAGLLGYSGYETLPWELLRREHVQALMSRLVDNHLAPSTRNTYLAAIKGVARESWLAGGLSSDEYQRINIIKSSKGSRINTKGRIIKEVEIESLLKSDWSSLSDLLQYRDRAIIALMLTCGLRKSEVSSIETANVNTSENYFTVIGKGDKEAKVFITPSAKPYLERWMQAKEGLTKYLFTPINKHSQVLDKQISGQGLTFILKRAAEISAIQPFAPHDTRRTFATKMIESGADLMKVRDAMRHKSIETTQIYNIQNEELLRAAVEAVDII